MGPDLSSPPGEIRPDRCKRIRRGFIATVVLYLALSFYYPTVVMARSDVDWGIAVEFAVIAFGLVVLVCLPLAIFTVFSWRHVSVGTRIMGLAPLTFPIASMVLAAFIEGVADWILG